MFSSCITLPRIWFGLDSDDLVFMRSQRWSLGRSVTGNGVLLQFLSKIISCWIDLIVMTFVVYLTWFYSTPSLFHTFSPSCGFQNGSFFLSWLIFFLFHLHFYSFLRLYSCCKYLCSEYSLTIPTERFTCLRKHQTSPLGMDVINPPEHAKRMSYLCESQL